MTEIVGAMEQTKAPGKSEAIVMSDLTYSRLTHKLQRASESEDSSPYLALLLLSQRGVHNALEDVLLGCGRLQVADQVEGLAHLRGGEGSVRGGRGRQGGF